jgi:predicted MPP superfamily phosphohydrolase
LYFAGGDCAYVDRFQLQPLLTQLPPEHCAILLTHEPDVADQTAASGRFDLQLSGHSHGGQMILPFYGPVLRIRLARKYTIGLHRVEKMQLYTNRGLGTALIPLRINCKPEITVITLRP